MVDLNIELPKGFLEEEVRCGYTVTRKMKEVWAVELDLLKEFKRVCNKYDLKYCADGGTLLGAIRHGNTLRSLRNSTDLRIVLLLIIRVNYIAFLLICILSIRCGEL